MARAQHVLNLGIRLTSPKWCRYLDECEIWNRKSHGPRQHCDDELRDEGLGALARTAELHDEQTAAVGIDDSRQRSAFAERLQVSRGGVGWQLRHAGESRFASARPEAPTAGRRRCRLYRPAALAAARDRGALSLVIR